MRQVKSDKSIANPKAITNGIDAYVAINKIKYMAVKITNITKYKNPITLSKKSKPPFLCLLFKVARLLIICAFLGENVVDLNCLIGNVFVAF